MQEKIKKTSSVWKNYIYSQKSSEYLCVFETNLWLFTSASDFTLKNALFGDFNLNKNFDSDKYKCFGYGIGFHSCLKM